MGDPLTASAAAGMGISLLGTALKGGSESAQLGARRNADLQNQQVSLAQAADAIARGNRQAGQERMKGTAVVAEQQAGFGASGVDEQVGTAAQLAGATKGISELDAQTAENNARRQAWGYQVTANQYGAQATLDKRAQGEAETGSVLGGLGQAASGFGRLYGADRGNLGGV